MEIDQVSLTVRLTDNPQITWSQDNKQKANELATGFAPVTALSDDYHIKVDGVLPTLESATTTAYTDILAVPLTNTTPYYGIGSRIHVKLVFSEDVILTNAVMPVDLGLVGRNISFPLNAVLDDNLSPVSYTHLTLPTKRIV